jgi:hypothetical protein
MRGRTEDIPSSCDRFGSLSSIGRGHGSSVRGDGGRKVMVADRKEESDSEEIEEVVVSSQDDEELKSELEHSTNATSEGERREEKEGERDLNEKSEDNSEAEDERMELMEEPGDRVGKALGREVILPMGDRDEGRDRGEGRVRGERQEG